MPDCYITRVLILLVSAAVAVVTIAGAYYTTYRIVTLLANN